MYLEIILGIFLGLVTYYVAIYLRNIIRYYSLMFKLPSQKRIPILGNIKELLCDEATFFKKLRKWSRDYGPVYTLTGFLVTAASITGPEEFEVIASSMKHIQKNKVYGFMYKWLGSGILTSTGELWQSRRKILTPAFHFSILRDFINVFNEETDQLVEILKQKTGEPVNVIPLISQCTLGAIVETSMGCKLNLQKESDKNYVKAIHNLGKIYFHRLVRPWLYPNFIFYLFFKKGRLEKRLIKTINSFTNNIIKNRAGNFEKIGNLPDEMNESNIYYGRKKMAMLDLLLNSKVTQGSIDDEGIKDEVNTIMFEAHDTTASAISFIFMLLANHKNVQDLVYEEIVKKLQNYQQQQHFTWSDLNDLKYMECVIKECLRLYPSVPIIGRTIEEDITLKGNHTIPKGCETYIHIFDIHRNPNYWPEPDKFDPDRFLPENCVNRHPFAYVPFSAGPRNCIGQKFAILEIKAVLSGILKNFILEPVDTPETIVLVTDIVLRPLNDSLLVKFISRL